IERRPGSLIVARYYSWLLIPLLTFTGQRVQSSPEVPSPNLSRAVESSPAVSASVDSGVVLRFLEDRVKQTPDDVAAQNRLGGLYLSLLRETGSLSYLDLARNCAKASIASVPVELNKGGLMLRTRVEQDSHQFVAARDDALH